MRKSVLGIITILVVLFEISTIGYASGKSNLILIFDASGSMWGQINGKGKITIAKEAMDLIVNDLPDDINIGLVAYGHRRKGDCDDVETLIPISVFVKQVVA
jgi:Ca-activated chloride channel homolog